MGAVHLKPRCVSAAVAPRLDAEQEFAVQELFSTIVQQHGIDAITEGEAHAGTDENVVPAIGIDVAHAHTPGPVRLNSYAIGNLLEFAPS